MSPDIKCNFPGQYTKKTKVYKKFQIFGIFLNVEYLSLKSSRSQILVILSEILAFVIGLLLVCPQGITDFAENGTWYQISEINIRHFVKLSFLVYCPGKLHLRSF